MNDGRQERVAHVDDHHAHVFDGDVGKVARQGHVTRHAADVERGDDLHGRRRGVDQHQALRTRRDHRGRSAQPYAVHFEREFSGDRHRAAGVDANQRSVRGLPRGRVTFAANRESKAFTTDEALCAAVSQRHGAHFVERTRGVVATHAERTFRGEHLVALARHAEGAERQVRAAARGDRRHVGEALMHEAHIERVDAASPFAGARVVGGAGHPEPAAAFSRP